MAKFVFKWTKATKGGYPYNHNCVLTVNDKKVASTKGGGFDMQGVVLAMYLRKKYPQETQNMPDGTIGFQHINEKWFKKLEGHKLSLVKAKNNVIEME